VEARKTGMRQRMKKKKDRARQRKYMVKEGNRRE
jgi:hypothetical protein